MKKRIIPCFLSLLLLGSCGGGNDNKDEVKECTNHEYGEWSTVAEAKCEEEGSRERICILCGLKETEKIDALEHDYRIIDDQTGAVASTCKDKGTKIVKCTKCDKKSTIEAELSTEHKFVDAQDQTGAVVNCVTKGTAITQCSVCGIKSTREADPAGHDMSVTGTVEKYMDLTPYTVKQCSRDKVAEIKWAAKDFAPTVTDELYNNEPNAVVDGDGVKFWGRPIGNELPINADGNPSSNTRVTAYNKDIEGSYIEYNINLPFSMKNVKFSADILNNMYATEAGLFGTTEGDWTPGLIKDKSAEAGYRVSNSRYVLTVNGNDVALDLSKDKNVSERGWNDFPCTFNLKKGVNCIRLTMAGGYISTFYNFSIYSDEVSDSFKQPSVDFKGFEVGFEKDDNVDSVVVFKDKGCTQVDQGPKFYTRNSAGRLLDDGEGQVSFQVNVKEGFKVKKVSVTGGEYKNIKEPSVTFADCNVENVYRITKVEDDIVVHIETEPTLSDAGFRVKFVTVNCSVIVHKGGDNTTVDDEVNDDGSYFSRLKDGTASKGEKTQMNFTIVPNEGYKFEGLGTGIQVDVVAYNKLEFEDETTLFVHLTKVTGAMTITVTCVPIA